MLEQTGKVFSFARFVLQIEFLWLVFYFLNTRFVDYWLVQTIFVEQYVNFCQFLYSSSFQTMSPGKAFLLFIKYIALSILFLQSIQENWKISKSYISFIKFTDWGRVKITSVFEESSCTVTQKKNLLTIFTSCVTFFLKLLATMLKIYLSISKSL